MRDGSLSYEAFCAEAELLQQRSHELASRQRVGRDKCVATWDWKHGNRQHLDGNSYLISTENVRQLPFDIDLNTLTAPDIVEAQHDGVGKFLRLCLASKFLQIHVEEVQKTVHQSGKGRLVLFEFHIVYHTIYQTPVLYFRALAEDGTPLSFNCVTNDVLFPGSDEQSTFVAMDMHPVLDEPFAFLHPCETAPVMQLLQAQFKDLSSLRNCNVPHYLASWLSLVHPLTGISPLDYYFRQ
ncbi:hypothetical protein CCR75_005263 [Bremia lactucae]|uniref:Ubiquitin-like-conjugating enzyme ATG10 n=1 Tax=Bremia lactucae TaxID=4779 RepID=A0A976FLN6_BRELC|nr:hypothetical protein CCR75_005263 [Bremia lactucae]